jgi:hypothetical protein
MKNKEIKFYANKIVALENQLQSAETKEDKRKIQIKIEQLMNEIMSSPNGLEDFLKIDELVQEKICK